MEMSRSQPRRHASESEGSLPRMDGIRPLGLPPHSIEQSPRPRHAAGHQLPSRQCFDGYRHTVKRIYVTDKRLHYFFVGIELIQFFVGR